MSGRRRAQDGVSEAELRLACELEARPRPKPRALAAQVGLGENGAWRLFNRLRDRGVLKTVTLVNPSLVAGPCECLAYLDVDLTERVLVARLEADLARDRRITDAARVAGNHDYVVRSFHADEYQANAWFRRLLEAPGVIGGELRFCRSVLVRCAYARALLGPASSDSGTG